MRGRRILMVGAYVVASVVLVAGVAVFALDRAGDDEGDGGDRTRSELPVLAPMPFASALTMEGADTGPVGTEFALDVTSYGEGPPARVDLYDGGRRVASAAPDPDAPAGSVPVTFPALSVGPHALHAEVTDAEGNVSLSPVEQVDVVVAPPPGSVVAVDDAGDPLPDQPAVDEAPDVVVPVTPEEGETLGAFAARLDVDPAQLTVYPSPDDVAVPQLDLDPSAVVPSGSQVVATVRPDAGVDALTSGSAVASGAIGRPEVAGTRVMGLTAEADGCDAALTASGSDGPVTFFDGSTGASGWAEVGQTDGDGELRLAALSPGAHSYFARTAERVSGTVSVTVPIGCAEDAGWTGDAKIVDGRLHLTPAAAGRVYLYLQIDGGTSVRIPEDVGLQGRVINAGVETDIRDQMPDLSGELGSSAELQVWSGGEFPQQVGSGSLTLPEGLTIADVVGPPGVIDLDAEVPESANPLSDSRGVVLGHADEDLSFRWEAASTDVDEVLWEVLSGSPDGVAPGGSGVLAAGISEASPAGDGSGTEGSFTVSTADIPGHEVVAADGDTPPLPADSAPAVVVPALTPSALTTLDGSAFVRPVGVDEVPDGVVPFTADLPGPGAFVHVRVTANPKGPALGTASNPVSVGLPTPEPPESAETGVTMKVDEMTLDPGRAPNAAYTSCAKITLPSYYGDRTLDRGFWKNAAHAVYTHGNGTYCYVPPAAQDDCDLDDYLPVVGEYACDIAGYAEEAIGVLVDLVTAVYSGVSKVYNGIIDTAVDALATFNPLCIALQHVDDTSGKTCEDLTASVAQAAISTALASVGLPPRLPTAEQLAAIAAGELDALAVALMEQAGVPCAAMKASPAAADAIEASGGKLGQEELATVAADPCLALATYTIGKVRDGVAKLVASRTAQATGLPDFSNLPGFRMDPEPRSLAEPMEVRVVASPVDPAVDATGLVCDESLLPSAGPEGYPGPFVRWSPIRLTEEAPIDGKGRWVGVAALSNYLPVGDLAGALTDLDVTVSLSMTSEDGYYGYGACRDGEGSVTERVRPGP